MPSKSATAEWPALRARYEGSCEMEKTTEAPWRDMCYYNSMLDLIGDTPLIHLKRVAGDVPPLVLAKMEFFNLVVTVKDRIGLAMIENCKKQSFIRPVSTILLPTNSTLT